MVLLMVVFCEVTEGCIYWKLICQNVPGVLNEMQLGQHTSLDRRSKIHFRCP